MFETKVFYLGRDRGKTGFSYDLFSERPAWQPELRWKGKIGAQRISLADKNVAWMFPGVKLQPGECITVKVGR